MRMCARVGLRRMKEHMSGHANITGLSELQTREQIWHRQDHTVGWGTRERLAHTISTKVIISD